jgi:hypothetical protein
MMNICTKLFCNPSKNEQDIDTTNPYGRTHIHNIHYTPKVVTKSPLRDKWVCGCAHSRLVCVLIITRKYVCVCVCACACVRLGVCMCVWERGWYIDWVINLVSVCVWTKPFITFLAKSTNIKYWLNSKHCRHDQMAWRWRLILVCTDMTGRFRCWLEVKCICSEGCTMNVLSAYTLHQAPACILMSLKTSEVTSNIYVYEQQTVAWNECEYFNSCKQFTYLFF